MDNSQTFEIFLVCAPGLEVVLCEEAQEKGFADAVAVPGGVTVQGGWPEVWRANLELRGAARVLVRLGSFMAFHLAQLDKRSRKFAWGDVLRTEASVVAKHPSASGGGLVELAVSVFAERGAEAPKPERDVQVLDWQVFGVMA